MNFANVNELPKNQFCGTLLSGKCTYFSFVEDSLNFHKYRFTKHSLYVFNVFQSRGVYVNTSEKIPQT